MSVTGYLVSSHTWKPVKTLTDLASLFTNESPHVSSHYSHSISSHHNLQTPALFSLKSLNRVTKNRDNELAPVWRLHKHTERMLSA